MLSKMYVIMILCSYSYSFSFFLEILHVTRAEKKPFSTSLFKQNLRTAILKAKVSSHKRHYFFCKISN